ncbi:hypothetical protein [Alteromonas sp. RKMC-009]|uniref:hypothetical protein n=1 Tax=Alteromonas sp. RKMC-009 TaxID=2267264 RepID=UPI000E67B1A7|nr:hypothetical protein [Alteromonas sp. RKMC-009]AYA64170.1 hypothetical protein DS731_09300 [Alteromonas sp. RKMC-009]
MNEYINAVANGEVVTGYRTITGKRKLTQTVTYGGITEPDNCQYKANAKDGEMLAVAQLTLVQIATGRTMKK